MESCPTPQAGSLPSLVPRHRHWLLPGTALQYMYDCTPCIALQFCMLSQPPGSQSTFLHALARLLAQNFFYSPSAFLAGGSWCHPCQPPLHPCLSPQPCTSCKGLCCCTIHAASPHTAPYVLCGTGIVSIFLAVSGGWRRLLVCSSSHAHCSIRHTFCRMSTTGRRPSHP